MSEYTRENHGGTTGRECNCQCLCELLAELSNGDEITALLDSVRMDDEALTTLFDSLAMDDKRIQALVDDINRSVEIELLNCVETD